MKMKLINFTFFIFYFCSKKQEDRKNVKFDTETLHGIISQEITKIFHKISLAFVQREMTRQSLTVPLPVRIF